MYINFVFLFYTRSCLILPIPLALPVLSCWAPSATIMKIEIFIDVTFYHWENSSHCFRELYSLPLQGQGSKKWWRWKHYNPLKYHELLSWQQNITPLMTWIFSNTMARISYLVCYHSILIAWSNDYRFFFHTSISIKSIPTTFHTLHFSLAFQSVTFRKIICVTSRLLVLLSCVLSWLKLLALYRILQNIIFWSCLDDQASSSSYTFILKLLIWDTIRTIFSACYFQIDH